eukprot:11579110-Karenia_brevis.AAC.1
MMMTMMIMIMMIMMTPPMGGGLCPQNRLRTPDRRLPPQGREMRAWRQPRARPCPGSPWTGSSCSPPKPAQGTPPNSAGL